MKIQQLIAKKVPYVFNTAGLKDIYAEIVYNKDGTLDKIFTVFPNGTKRQEVSSYGSKLQDNQADTWEEYKKVEYKNPVKQTAKAEQTK